MTMARPAGFLALITPIERGFPSSGMIHSSASQYAHSIKIAKSAIRPGDLVFYTSGGSVYHVGIYAGSGLIWDAPHTGLTVRLEKIATSSWVAGRVL